MTQFKLQCSECGKDKFYSTKRSLDTAKYLAKKNGYSYCKECTAIHLSESLSGRKNPRYKRRKDIEKKFFKSCSMCGEQQGYSTEKLLKEAVRLDTKCLKCAGTLVGNGIRLNNSLSQEKRLQMIATREGFSDYLEYQETMKAYKRYLLEVWRLTYKQPIENIENFNKRGMSGIDGAYQIDHFISIREGFMKNIPAETIASLSNLRMIPWRENIKKSCQEQLT